MVNIRKPSAAACEIKRKYETDRLIYRRDNAVKPAVRASYLDLSCTQKMRQARRIAHQLYQVPVQLFRESLQQV